MTDKPSHQGLAGSRKFVPQVGPLESRLLLSRSQMVSFPDGASITFPTLVKLPRTGGVFVQSGTVLAIGVGQATTNDVNVADNGGGSVTAEWNGGPVHALKGVDSAVIELQRARTDQVTIAAGGDTFTARTAGVGTAFHHPGPSTGSAAIDLSPPDSAGGAAVPHLTRMRTSGSAVQSGSVLTVTVTRAVSNTVQISNEGVGAVLVRWNGGAIHSFSGVETIVVDTHNGRNNTIALHDVTG